MDKVTLSLRIRTGEIVLVEVGRFLNCSLVDYWRGNEDNGITFRLYLERPRGESCVEICTGH